MSEIKKELYDLAEVTSFDLDNKLILIKFKNGHTTRIPFSWIKNIYPQVVKLEEHVIIEKETQ